MGGMWESSSIGTAAPRVADSTPLPDGPDGGGTPRPPDGNRLSKVADLHSSRLPGRLTASGPPARHGATAPFRETRSSLSTPSRIAVHHQGHHYITSRPQSTSSYLLLYTHTHSAVLHPLSSWAASASPRPPAGPVWPGTTFLPQQLDGLAAAQLLRRCQDGDTTVFCWRPAA